jgi:hypothetical protein
MILLTNPDWDIKILEKVRQAGIVPGTVQIAAEVDYSDPICFTEKNHADSNFKKMSPPKILMSEIACV